MTEGRARERVTEIPALLAMAFRAVTDQVQARLAAAGFEDVRPSHGYAFQFLSWRPDGVTAVALAEHLEVTKQAAVQLVEDLERRGYVTRRPHPTDRRARLVTLTPRGWACIETGTALWREVEDGWAELIGRDRLEQLRADLAAFVQRTAGDGPPAIRPVW